MNKKYKEDSRMNKITNTKIYNISNVDTLLPGYSHHWIVTSDAAPEIIYETEQPTNKIESGLWYNFNSNEEHGSFMFDYHLEKLALDTESSLYLMAKWKSS